MDTSTPPATQPAAATAGAINQEFWELTLNRITEAIMVVQDDRIRYFNQKALDIAGYTRADTYLDQPFVDFVAPEDRQTVLDRHRRRASGEEVPNSYQLRILHRQGHEIWLQLNALRIDWQGRPASLAFLSDITAQKEMEAQLFRARQDWEATFDAIDEAILVVDPGYRVVQANRAAGELFDRQKNELLGTHCYRLFHDADSQPADCPACKMVGPAPCRPLAMEIWKPDLGRHISLKCFPRLDASGALTGIVHVAADISAARKAEEDQKNLEIQLIQAQKMESIGTLAGGIAHDFNNLLTAIIGYSELASQELAPDQPACKHLQEVTTAGQRARDLVRQILTFSRKTAENRSAIDLPALIDECLGLLRASLPKTIDITTDITPGCGPILADRVQINQILMNLCSNAAHAMEETGGRLEISLRPTTRTADETGDPLGLRGGTYLELTVRDSGHGMPEEVLKRIFEPYFTTKPAGQGTGLGLSVVHGIVRSHGGDINVESSEDGGTVFTVLLPQLDAPAPAAWQEDADNGHDLTGRGRILLVDDEPYLIDLGRRLLTRLGYEVEAVQSGQQAIDRIRADPERFDAVLTDLTMPRMTGLELGRHLYALRPDLPVLLTTGYDAGISQERLEQSNICLCLPKPYSSADLGRALGQVFRKTKS